MHRIDADAHVSNLFSNGDPGIGQPGTKVDADWLNAVQEELCNLVEVAGIALVKADHTQVEDAVRALIASRVQVTWQNVANFVTNWMAGPVTPQFCKDANGWVRFRGSITSTGTPGPGAFSMPAGFWPATGSPMRVPICNETTDAIETCRVVPNDHVYPAAVVTSGHVYCLDGLSYYAG